MEEERSLVLEEYGWKQVEMPGQKLIIVKYLQM